jgi:hypothetical protein
VNQDDHQDRMKTKDHNRRSQKETNKKDEDMCMLEDEHMQELQLLTDQNTKLCPISVITKNFLDTRGV